MSASALNTDAILGTLVSLADAFNAHDLDRIMSYFAEDAVLEGALLSQCVPTDPNLWNTDNYREFLLKRRKELAERMNTFIQSKAGL